jgi:hypothetical protein
VKIRPEGSREIIRATVGSELHGVGIPGTDDHDEMGVLIEPPEWVIAKNFEQEQFRTKPEGVRSGPGDIDRTVYTLRKYVRLALNGNPTILLLFYIKPDHVMLNTATGIDLQRVGRNFMVSLRSGNAFLGYLKQQRERMLGIRGGRHTNRPELVEKYGFDTKYAMHMCRLGHQGMQLLSEGTMELPVPEDMRNYLLAIRKGEVQQEDCIQFAEVCERGIKEFLDGTKQSPLREKPATDYVHSWLTETYMSSWEDGQKGLPQ